MNKLSVILNDTPRFLARARNDMGVILRRKPKNLGVILVVFLVLTALFLHFTKGTKAVGWWTGGGGSWQARKQLTITNNSSSSLSANTTVAITIDTATLVSQGKLRSDCADLRVLYQPSSSTTTELSRSLSYASTSSASSTGAGTCSTSYATKVFIPLQAAISASASSTDYYLYYKNPSASAPSSTDNAFDISSIDATLVCPFDGTTTCAAGETPSTETGAIRYSGSKSAMSFDGVNDQVALPSSSSSLNITNPSITVEMWVKFTKNADSVNLIKENSLEQFSLRTDSSFRPYGEFSIGPSYNPRTGTAGNALVPNVWTHLATTYDGTNIKLYQDGILTSTTAYSGSQLTSSASNNVVISLNNTTAAVLIDEVRISNVVRYTGNFTPSVSPFVRDSNTKLLLHFDENGDDPRNTGKTIDDSGNGNHGTITGAKYVSGLVGVDNGTSDTGNISRQSYAGHEGVMIEEGTTNLVTNPSFENSTFNTNWTAGSNLTASSMGSTPYYKFGSTSAKLVASASAISGTSNMFTTNINVGSSATHMLSAYVYDGTSGNVGGTVSSSIAKIVFQGVAQTTTYTDMGGGWWRLSYTTSAGGAQEFGIEPQVSKTIYVDGVQLEAKSYATTYTDGSLGSSYAWTGTANNSTSTRTVSELAYSTTNNISLSAGTVSLWAKTEYLPSNVTQLAFGARGTSSNQLYIKRHADGTYLAYISPSNAASEKYIANSSPTAGKWAHLVITYTNGGSLIFYVNGSAASVSGITTPDNLSSIYIGSGSSQTSQWEGSISDLRIYDSVLSTTQVTDLYQAGLVGHSESYQVDAFGDTKGQSPVSTYHMDEATGSTVYDSTLQANNLTLGTGSSAPSWETSHSSSNQINPRAVSLKFDGSNDYISRTYDSDFDPGTDSFSISGWFRHPSTISGQDIILSRYGSAGYKVYMNSSGYICFGIDDDSTWTPDDSACSTTSYADSKWHSFEAVKTSTTSITLYLDGRSVASDSSLAATATLNTGVTTSMYMGIDSDFASNPWDGYLDEFNFYPYARSAAQVKTDYGAAQRGTTLGASTDDPLTNGLVGYWKMDEGTGATVVDSSGNGNTGNLTNGASFSAGKFGTEVLLDGSNDYMDINNTPITTGSLTYSVWIKPTAVGGDIIANMGTLYSIGNPATSLSWYSDSSQGNVNCSVGGVTLTDGSWHHVALTQSGTRVNCYIDGSYASTTTAPVINTSATYSSIGARTSGTAPMTGGLDEVRMYNRALSPGEVQQLYNFAPGPVGYWKLDEVSDGTAAVTRYDSSGNGNNLTDGNTVTSKQGKYGQSGKFTVANSEYLYVADNSNLNVTSSDSFTIGAWALLDSKPGTQMVIASKMPSNSIGGWKLIWHNSVDAFYLQTFSSGGSVGCNNGSTSPTLGQWYYVTASFDAASNTCAIYINGVLKSSGVPSATMGSTTTSFGIGALATTASLFWDGQIDDVKFYRYARSQKQILEDMQGGRPVTTAASQQSGASAAVVQYRFDEGQGTTANNVGIGGTGYNGALGTGVSAPTWTNTGKFGKALSFDGGDKVTATITDPAYTNAISLWINPTTSIASKTIVTAGKLTTDSSSRPVYGGCTGTALSLSTWTHIVAVSDGSTVCKIYQNGVQTASSTTGVTFGTLVNIASGSFIGSIDEVKVYSHAITAAEAKADYNRGATAILGATGNNSSYAANAANQEYCVPGDSTSCSAPILEYKFDEASGTATQDSSGSGNSGTLTNGPVWTVGKQGAGVRFANSTDYVRSTSDPINGLTAWTIEAWIYPTGSTRAFLEAAGASHYYSITSGTSMVLHWSAGSQMNITTPSISANAWHHVVFRYDGTNGTAFVDGVKGSDTAAAGITGYNGSAMLIGQGNGVPDNFAGVVDTVRVFNYARTAAQVAYDYNGGKPIAHYRMDECSGSTAYDSSGNANSGTLTVGASGTQTTAGNCDSNSTASAWSNGKSGKFNSSLNFDGTDDYIGLGTSASVFEPTSSLSVSAWAKRSGALANFSGIFASRKNSLTEFGYILVGTSANKIRFYVYNTSAWAYAESDSALTSGQWYNLNGVWDGSTVKLYVDGKLQSTSASATTITYPSSIGFEHAIGRYGSSYWPGQIDDVRIYNYALSSSQVKNVYNGGAAVYYGPASGTP